MEEVSWETYPIASQIVTPNTLAPISLVPSTSTSLQFSTPPPPVIPLTGSPHQGLPSPYTSSSSSSSPKSPMVGWPWLSVGPIAIPGDQHDLQKHSERWLPKYNPYGPIIVEEHVKQFMLSLKLGVVQNEDQVCKLFRSPLRGNL